MGLFSLTSTPTTPSLQKQTSTPVAATFKSNDPTAIAYGANPFVPTGQYTNSPTSVQIPVTQSQTGIQTPVVGSTVQTASPTYTNQQAQQIMADSNAALGISPGAKVSPVNYNVPVNTNNPIPSSLVGTQTSQSDLADMWKQKYNDLLSGKDPNLNASDNLMQQIFSAKQYTPEEQANLQNLSDINSTITAATLSERRQIKQLQEDGMLTKEQASAFTSEAQRRADAHLADLTAAQTGITNSLGVQAAIRGNNLGALQSLFDMTKGTMTLSPGQSLYSATGNQVAGAQGIAPQVTSLATQLYQQSLTTGNTMVDPQTGQPDFQKYLQQASLLTGLPLPMNMQSSSVGATTPGAGTQGGTYGAQGYGNINMIPQGLQKYVTSETASDSMKQPISFIPLDQVPDALKDTMKQYAKNSGIPALDANGVSAFRAAQQILNIVDATKALSIRNLGSGVSGRITNTMKNWANSFLQNNPDLSNFAQLSDAASKATTALAGGSGSGFRMNSGIIDNAVKNMPTANDNLETALSKADALATQILTGLKPVFPNITTENYGNLLQSQYGGGSSIPTANAQGKIINTKAGAVDNSWFN